MSRPNAPALTAPSYSVRTWSTTTNYPAGSNLWSSNATKVEYPAAALGFTPGQGIGAPYLNKLFSDAYTLDQQAKDAITALKTSLDARDAELIASFGQVQALNWFTKTTPTIDTGLALWDAANRRWCLVTDNVTAGSSGKFTYSTDSGKTWSSTVTATGITSVTVPTCGDFDSAGNAVVGVSSASLGFSTHDDNSCLESTGGTWTKRTVTGLSVDGAAVGAFYDPIHTKWSIVQLTGGGAVVCSTSTNRTAWTAATLTASFASGFVAAASAIRKDTGRIVLFGNRSTDSKIYVAKSDDGGATWADLLNFARPGNIAAFGLVHVGNGTWICTMVASTGTTTYTYKSTDNGATWTLASTVATQKIFSIVAVGSLLVGYAVDGSSNQTALYSTDLGTTWKYSNHVFATSGTGKGVFYGGGQVLALTGPDVIPGFRYGDPGATVT